MESQFYQINLLKLLLKWRVHLAVIVIAAAALSAFFSGPLFLKPKYKSFAIVYPSNVAPYSDENETEQMLQIMQSNQIRDQLIEKFNLIEHYAIDTTEPKHMSWLYWEYSKNVRIGKTPYEGVNIEVLDTDPQIACDMVNAILDLYDQKVRSLHEEKFGEVVAMYERALDRKQHYLDSLKNRLAELGSKYGLMDYEAQSEQVTRGYLRTIDGQGAAYVRDRELEKLKEEIGARGGEMLFLQNLIENESGNFARLQDEYERAVMDYDRQFTYSNVVSSPYPADKKAWPVRWLIVVISTLAAFFISVLTIMIIEHSRSLAEKSK